MYTGKKRRFFKVFKVAGKIFITTVSKKNVQKKSDEGPWWISTTSPQRFVDEYEYTSSRNDRWMMRLKVIEAEYYFHENQKS